MRHLFFLLLFSGISFCSFAQNVGIGTATPTQKLHVEGSFRLVDGNQAAGLVLTSDANGVGTWQVAPNSAGVVAKISSAGAVDYGTVSSTKTATGTYEITFPTAFVSPPVVNATPIRGALGGACAVTPCATAPAQASYCPANYSAGCDAFISGIGTLYYIIDGVTTSGGITNISDMSSNCSVGAYQQSVQTVQINPGASFNMSVGYTTNSTSVFASTAHVHIFIDWNQDGDYDDAGELVYESPGKLAVHNTTITAPCSAVCGTTRMRVRMDLNDFWVTPGGCKEYRLGETHDYNVEVNSPAVTSPGFCNVTGTTTNSVTIECYDVAGNLQDAAFGLRASE